MKPKELSPVMVFPIFFSSAILSLVFIKNLLPEMPLYLSFSISLFINMYFLHIKKSGFMSQIKEEMIVYGSVTYMGNTLFTNKMGWICLTKNQLLFIQNPSLFKKGSKYSYSLLDMKLLEAESHIKNSKIKNILQITLANGEVVKWLGYQPSEWIEDILKAKLALEQDQHKTREAA